MHKGIPMPRLVSQAGQNKENLFCERLTFVPVALTTDMSQNDILWITSELVKCKQATYLGIWEPGKDVFS